ncbi:hypothetical protein FACS1894133_6140 [Clostridia bacterium]|nr:hypothetical protein FACS1894133_6140 [Clostridia bacterium]
MRYFENLRLCDLKTMTGQERERLCAELRRVITNVCLNNTGHLASNLGVIELTVALHTVFESPKDKLLFDVGHQGYAHKILTGRAAQFHTLRREYGISGFVSPKESPHDPFVAGHAGIAVSAAAGFAAAFAQDFEYDRRAVVILGDGALTGGEVYEGLCNICKERLPVIIILNDNEYSISRNGASSGYLHKIRMSGGYYQAKSRIKQALSGNIAGRGVAAVLSESKNMVKKVVSPNNWFENLGLKYFVVPDGHNIQDIIEVLKVAKSQNAPALVHVRTKKGKGYVPAESNPGHYHIINRSSDPRPDEVMSQIRASRTGAGRLPAGLPAGQRTRFPANDTTVQSVTAQSGAAQSVTAQSGAAQFVTAQSAPAAPPTAQSPTAQSPTVQSVPYMNFAFSEVFGQRLAYLGKDTRVNVITAAMKYATGCNYFAEKYPSRFFDVGIAEPHAVTFAAALAACGKIPVFAVYSTFLQRCYDQLLHDAAIPNLHIVLGVDRAGFTGADGVTHQGIFDISILTAIPNTTIYAPYDAETLRLCLDRAVFEDSGIVAVRYPRGRIKPDTTGTSAVGTSAAGTTATDTTAAGTTTAGTTTAGTTATDTTATGTTAAGTTTTDVTAAGYVLVQDTHTPRVTEYYDILASGGSVKKHKLCITYGRLSEVVLRLLPYADVVVLLRVFPVNRDVVKTAMTYDEIYFIEESYINGGIGEKYALALPDKQVRVRAVTEFAEHAETERQLEHAGLDYESLRRFVTAYYAQ